MGGWRDGSGVNSTLCSSRDPEFNLSNHMDSSQPSIMESYVVFWHKLIYSHRVIVHKINKSFYKSNFKKKE